MEVERLGGFPFVMVVYLTKVGVREVFVYFRFKKMARAFVPAHPYPAAP